MKKLFACLNLFLLVTIAANAKMINIPLNDIKTGTQKIISEFAPLYSLPSDSASVLFTPLTGETVVVLSKTDETFSKVLYNKKTVYVKNSDISDNYEKAFFFNKEGSYATKFYNSVVSLPLYIPAKDVKQALKTMKPEESAFFNTHTIIDKTAKGKPYKIEDNYFDSFEEFHIMNDLCSKYFYSLDSKEQLVKNGNYLYVNASYDNYNSYEGYIYDEISDIVIYTKDFDGNSLLGFKYSNKNPEGPVEKKQKLITMDFHPRSHELSLLTVLDQTYYLVVAAEHSEYNIVFPGDLRGIHNKIRVYSKPGTLTDEDFYLTYKNNRFEKQNNFGILNRTATSIRNKPSVQGSKSVGVQEGTQQITIYGTYGSGKIQDGTYDLWYKIAQFEEKYVNAAAVNLFPFYVKCYDYEIKDEGEKKITNAYISDYDELFFEYSFPSNDIVRAENINWIGLKPTVVENFAKEFSEIFIQKFNLSEKREAVTEAEFGTLNSTDKDSAYQYSFIYGNMQLNQGYLTPKELTLKVEKNTQLPLGLPVNSSEKAIVSILGTPVQTITSAESTVLQYSTILNDNNVYTLEITVENNKITKLNLVFQNL